MTVPEAFLALIRGNAALLFWDIADSEPVWLSGSILQREITANSTYWKAKLRVRWAGGWGGGCGMGKSGVLGNNDFGSVRDQIGCVKAK